MKVRVTVLTENNKPASALGDNPEKQIAKAWEFLLAYLELINKSRNEDRATLESVEIVDEGEEPACD